MKTDARCKILARLRPTDLLALTGDEDAALLSTDIVELRELQRRVDFVYKLQRGTSVYYRHVEFQAQRDPEMHRRCFLYNALLLDQYQAPVITTIIYLFPQRESEEPVFRVELDGREINRWQFECVRLWELIVEDMLARGRPGLAVLAPLMKGAELQHVEQAVRQIEAVAPVAQQNDLLAILHAFAESKYTTKEIDRIIGRKRLMESSIYQQGRAEGRTEGRAEGRAEGRTEGRLEGEREICRAVVRKWHPRAGAKVWKAIAQCTDLEALKEVTINAPEWSTRAILQRLTAR